MRREVVIVLRHADFTLLTLENKRSTLHVVMGRVTNAFMKQWTVWNDRFGHTSNILTNVSNFSPLLSNVALRLFLEQKNK